MAATIETKRVYNQSDLASLVVGDRVNIDEHGDGEYNIGLVVYERLFKKDQKMSFLRVVVVNDYHILTRITINQDDISYDGEGRLQAGLSLDEESFEFYSSDKKSYRKELALLKQAGLYEK